MAGEASAQISRENGLLKPLVSTKPSSTCNNVSVKPLNALGFEVAENCWTLLD